MKTRLKESFINLGLTTHLVMTVVSAGIIVSYLTAQAVTPSWKAPGLPSYIGYPKNVENAALVASVLAAAMSAFFLETFRSFLLRFSSLILVPFAALIAYRHVNPAAPAGFALQAVNVLILSSFLYYFFKKGAGPPERANPLVILASGAAGFAVFFMLSVVYWFEYPLDVHHFGEQFTSAADLVSGGKPFITFHWPHGLEDTGIAALFFLLFSRVDMPTMLLSLAFATGLGAVVLLLLCKGMRLGYYSILILASVAVFNYALAFTYLTSFLFALAALVAFSRAERGFHFFAAGALVFVAHVYRIEYGVYAFVSIIALFLYLAAGSAIYDRRALIGLGREVILLLLGVFSTALFLYLVLGWPGREWYVTIFSILPKYHADSGGLPFPLFLKSMEHQYANASWSGIAFITAALSIAAITAGYLLRNIRHAGKIERFPVLALFFSVLMLKTAFGRSDDSHIYAAFLFPNLVLALIFSRVVAASAIRLPLKAALIALLFAFFNFQTARYTFAENPFMPHSVLFKGSYEILAGYGSQAPAQCSGSLFSRDNIRNPEYARFDRSVCGLKEQLARYGIGDKELLVTHSAPLIYPALGYGLPTKYYKIGLAITEGMQQEMVAELERNGVKAILRSNTGLPWYDIPDRDRLPLYSRWAEKRFDMENPVRTELGELYLLRGLK